MSQRYIACLPISTRSIMTNNSCYPQISVFEFHVNALSGWFVDSCEGSRNYISLIQRAINFFEYNTLKLHFICVTLHRSPALTRKSEVSLLEPSQVIRHYYTRQQNRRTRNYVQVQLEPRFNSIWICKRPISNKCISNNWRTTKKGRQTTWSDAMW